MTSTLHVSLGARSYDIVIGDQLLAEAGARLAPVLKRPRVIIVTDEHVAPLYLVALERSLDAASIAHQHIILPAGESTKSFAQFDTLLNKLLEFTPDRHTTLIALGGGVIGDITGFAASVLLRGVDFVQIPTTLLAQVDSSVGGKTGINTSKGKNLIGTFYQPRLVLIDTATLKTLPKREWLAGYAEVVKYGVIANYPFFTWLEQHGAQALSGDAEAVTHMICESCKAKSDIVSADEREAGKRALLNFGHTLGHALEAETGFSDRLLHGEAVALGMVLALQLSEFKGLCSAEDIARVREHLSQVGLPVSPLSVMKEWNVARLIQHCYGDKKALGGKLTFILSKGIGNSFISHEVTEKDLQALLAEALKIV